MWALVTVALVLSALLGVLYALTGLSLTISEREGESARILREFKNGGAWEFE